MGLRLSPCLTPMSDVKAVVIPVPTLTCNLILEYMLLIILYTIPFMPKWSNLYQRASWETESKAFLRSMKQANKGFFSILNFCISDLITKIWSAVLQPFRKPICSMLSNLRSSRNFITLVLMIELNSFPITLVIVMPR